MGKVDVKQYKNIKQRKRELKDRTREARKAKAFADGKRVIFLACPLCGRNRPLESHTQGRAGFQFTPEHFIIQVRYGGGRFTTEEKDDKGHSIGVGLGFFINDSESLTLEEMKAEYPDIIENLKEEVKKIALMLV